MRINIELILSLIKSSFFNLRHLPLSQAIRFPICIRYDVHCKIKGDLSISAPIRFALIRIGFHTADISNINDDTQIVVEKGGQLIFKGSAHLGRGTKMFVKKGAVLEFGDNFAISASSQIGCYKQIVFGKDIQFSWDCLVMDSDTHEILDKDCTRMNEDREIVFGDKIWIGCRTIVLKGSRIPSNCVVGANSLISGQQFEERTIIVGNPAKSIKRIGGWKL